MKVYSFQALLEFRKRAAVSAEVHHLRNGLEQICHPIRKKGPWKGLDELEFATFEWVDWWTHRRLLGPIGMIPPSEVEQLYYSQGDSAVVAVTQGTEIIQ